MALDTSSKMLNDYKNEFYDIMEKAVNNSLGNGAVKKQLESLKIRINRTLSFSSGEEKEKLNKILDYEMSYIDKFTKKGFNGNIASNLSTEFIDKINSRKIDQNDSKTEQPKEDLNKINVRRINELEELLESLNLGFENLVESINFDEVEERLPEVKKYEEEFYKVLKDMQKIYRKTSNNSKEFLPNVKNEEDRTKWEQENKDLLNKINSLIPNVMNSIKKVQEKEKVYKMFIITSSINHELEEKKQKKNEEEMFEETVDDNQNDDATYTEEQFYNDLANGYVEEEIENEEYDKNSNLYLDYMEDEGITEEEFEYLEDETAEEVELDEENFEEPVVDPIEEDKKQEENEEEIFEETVEDNQNDEETYTEEQFYNDLANGYVEEEIENEEYDKNSNLYLDYLEDEGITEEEENELDEEDFEESELDPVDDEEIEEEENELDEEDFEESDLDPIDDEEVEEESEVDKRIKKYIDFSKIKSEKEVVRNLNIVRNNILSDVLENPKKYREIRKVFKRIYYDDLDFNGDIFTSNLFADDTPQYLGGKMYRDDHERLKESIELYKQMSTEGKIPQNEIDTFDEYVLAPYELQHIVIDKDKDENEMVKKLRSQTKSHKEMDEEIYQSIGDDEFIIDEDDLNI